jgi:hypothetical protein
MKPTVLLISFVFCLNAFSQNDTTKIRDTAITIVDTAVNTGGEEQQALKVFYGQRLINANTVEVLRKGVMEFRVAHNFSDIAGNNGGINNFFGLDNSTDVRIGFQLGLLKDFNVIAAHAKGGSYPFQLWELGVKYQLLHQELNGTPFSLTAFASIVSTGQKIPQDSLFHLVPNTEYSFKTSSDRLSQVFQLMIARRFGNVSLQLSPTFVHRNYVIQGDDNGIFALGGGIRLPITKGLVVVADYFHPFRSELSKNTFAAKGVHFYDAFGIGFEILTWGHVFHMNFTNATEILEYKFISHTTTSWGKGQYRWGFMLSRNFTVFKNKKQK